MRACYLSISSTSHPSASRASAPPAAAPSSLSGATNPYRCPTNASATVLSAACTAPSGASARAPAVSASVQFVSTPCRACSAASCVRGQSECGGGGGRGRGAHDGAPGEGALERVCERGRLAVGPVPGLRGCVSLCTGVVGWHGTDRELGHALRDLGHGARGRLRDAHDRLIDVDVMFRAELTH
jgi:hypothetical protein